MNGKRFPPSSLELGLGLLSIGRTWGVASSEPPGEEGVAELLSEAIDRGIRIFDTAPAYASSEIRFGRFLRALPSATREQLVVMTKAGEHWDFERGTSFVDHTRDALCRSLDRSLERLGPIDVLQIHKATREVVRDPAVLAALDYARNCGIGMFGASVSDLEAGRAALESGAYQALQFPLNRINRGLERLLPAIGNANATPIVNRPLAMGSLAASEGQGCAPKDAFRFLAERIEVGVVLTGTGKATHLAHNVEAFRQGVVEAATGQPQSGVQGT